MRVRCIIGLHDWKTVAASPSLALMRGLLCDGRPEEVEVALEYCPHCGKFRGMIRDITRSWNMDAGRTARLLLRWDPELKTNELVSKVAKYEG